MSIVDTFNRADSATTLGTTSDGTATWTAHTGTFGISTNQAYAAVVPGGAWALATVPSAADGTSQVTFATATTCALAFRLTDANNFWIAYVNGLYKVIAGAFTSMASFTITDGAVISVVASGTSITVKNGGTTVGSATDSFNQTATRIGMYVSGTGAARLDDFSCPSGAAPPAYRSPRLTVVRRAISRASVI